MTKTIKLALALSQKDLDRKELNAALWEQQWLASKAANRVMTFLYADTQTDFIMKETGLEIPNQSDMYGKARMSYLYDKMSEIMTTSYSGNVGQTRAFVEAQYKKDIKKGLLKGECSLTSFRSDCALYLHNKSYELFVTDKGYGVAISLFNKKKSKELGLKNGKIEFALPKANKGEKAVLARMVNGEYKQGAGSLTYNKEKKKWMLSMSFSFEAAPKTGANIMTVRLDKDVLMRVTVTHGPEKKVLRMKRYDDVIPGVEELDAYRKKMNELRRAYGNATRIASENNCGKGYRKRADKKLKLGEKESRFRDTFNHKISRYIIALAKRYDVGLIELEDFDEVKEKAINETKGVSQKGWPYYDLMQKITYKGQAEGIEVIETSTKPEEKEAEPKEAEENAEPENV